MNNLALMNDFARGSGNDKQLINAYERCANSYGIATKELEVILTIDYAYACKR